MKKMSCQEIEEILVDYSDGLFSRIPGRYCNQNGF